jgi:hypothetical protein
MIQRFECKEPDCDKVVEYDYETIEFLDEDEPKELPRMPDEVDVYLTCENGHTYSYKVGPMPAF